MNVKQQTLNRQDAKRSKERVEYTRCYDRYTDIMPCKSTFVRLFVDEWYVHFFVVVIPDRANVVQVGSGAPGPNDSDKYKEDYEAHTEDWDDKDKEMCNYVHASDITVRTAYIHNIHNIHTYIHALKSNSSTIRTLTNSIAVGRSKI